jgi:3-oxoacyl-[acyl-carrier-protein] synthase II
MKFRRVVVTGMGVLSPLGNTVEDFWGRLISGESAAERITKFETKNLKTQFACQIKEHRYLELLDHKEKRINDPYVQYALAAVAQAVADSQIDFREYDSKRTGVVWGTGNGAISTMEREFSAFFASDEFPKLSPYFIPGIIMNIASGVLSIKYGLQGPAYTPVAACATANVALMQAANSIRYGEADLMIAGASDAAITPTTVGGFNALKALSTRNDDPKSASRPFDQERDGFVIGEGAGTLILEEYEHAMRRGAKVYAELAGASLTSDAFHLTSTHPDGDGGSRAMINTLKQADLSTVDISLINAHATSTKLGDVSEIRALQQVFGPKLPAITANKSMIGHLLGASGAVEAIATVLSVQRDIIPPTINLDRIDPDLVGIEDSINTEKKEYPVDAAMSNSFGFGGHNAVVLFKKI